MVEPLAPERGGHGHLYRYHRIAFAAARDPVYRTRAAAIAFSRQLAW